ncbi:unnamed protein product [Paramecium primaurelia]|uniref:Uncharacterized protein n=1 Tax=Paramecium primaurelia TaxID=5886 RepID=A0A8S1P8J5_PARPR|nr:unnamed protein product [Paramecium primaurelia]
MILVSFIKIIFPLPFLLYKDCVQIPGSDCIDNSWTNAHEVVECQGINYMGSFTGGRKISRTYWCPSEKQIKFSFTLAKFDSWDNESVFVYKDNVLIDNISYGPYEGTPMCVLSYFPDLMVKKLYQFMLSKGQNYVKFELVDNLQAISEESWGIRDIKIEVLEPCVDFYSECNFQGDLWKICSGNQTTFAKFVPFKIKSIYILNGITVQLRDSKYHGGILQIYTSNQTCLDDFHFPKYEKLQ